MNLIGIFLIIIALWQSPTPAPVLPEPPVPVKPKPDSILVPKPAPAPKVKWVIPRLVEYPAVRDKYKQNNIYSAVLNRHRVGHTQGSRETQAHETVHFINSSLRNALVRKTTEEINKGLLPLGYSNKLYCIFMAPNQYVTLVGPKMRKSNIAEFVPDSLQFTRYPLYVVGQTAWDDMPLYVLDEWSAYMVGAQVGIEDHNNGVSPSGTTDVAEGTLEMAIYSVAMCMAIEKNDPKALTPEFMGVIDFMLHRAEKIFSEGRKIFPHARQEKMLNNLKNSPDAESMRQYLKYNFDGVLLDLP